MRSAGTTQASQLALRQQLIKTFKDLLPSEGDLMILGDLFDTASIPMLDVLATFEALADWLQAHPSSVCYNVAGNHDLSKVSTMLSSFQFLGKLLYRQFPSRYIHIEEPTLTPYGFVIPHLRNQDLFNQALANVPSLPKLQRLFLHCNYDNGFAAQSDQSLNLSKEQVLSLPVEEIILGHEHHTREVGKVLIPGNQVASSIADWLGPSDKRFIKITDGVTCFVRIAEKASQFVEFDWKSPGKTDAKFVRFTGTATQEEVSSAISAINRYRASSDALVVANGVQVVTPDGVAEAFNNTLTSVQAFDIKAALREVLTISEMEILDELC